MSANGQRLAFVAGQRGEYELFHRGLDSDAAAIPSLRGDLKAPFLSPDGAWVAVFHSGKLRKYPVAGGSVETICDAPSGHGGAWSDRGTIVFTGSHTSGLSSVSERGGPVTTLTTPKFEDGELAHYWPAFLPDGQTVLFTSARTTEPPTTAHGSKR